MTVDEFKIEFDILYNNLASNAAPPINDYEKSVFLTKAQEELVLEYIRPQTNSQGIGIDADPLRRSELKGLMTRGKLSVLPSTNTEDSLIFGTSSYTYSYEDKGSIIAVLSETAIFTKVVNGKTITVKKAVVTLSDNEITRVTSKIYSRPPKRQVWKISDVEYDSELADGTYNPTSKCTIIGDADLEGFTLSYISASWIRKPKPIILSIEDAPTSGELLTIGGETISPNQVQSSELPAFMHQTILQRAVELAKQAYLGVQAINNNQ